MVGGYSQVRSESIFFHFVKCLDKCILVATIVPFLQLLVSKTEVDLRIRNMTIYLHWTGVIPRDRILETGQ